MRTEKLIKNYIRSKHHKQNPKSILRRQPERKREMLIGLKNNYGYEKHELVAKVEDNFEYAGTDTRNGIIYDCYLVPNGITYKAVCVEHR